MLFFQKIFSKSHSVTASSSHLPFWSPGPAPSLFLYIPFSHAPTPTSPFSFFFWVIKVYCVSEVWENLSFSFVLVIKQQGSFVSEAYLFWSSPKTVLFLFQSNPKFDLWLLLQEEETWVPSSELDLLIGFLVPLENWTSLKKPIHENNTTGLNMLLMHPWRLRSGLRERGVGPCFGRSGTDLWPEIWWRRKEKHVMFQRRLGLVSFESLCQVVK